MFIIVLDVKKFNILFSCVKTFGLQTKYCSLTYLQKHECEMDGYCISLRGSLTVEYQEKYLQVL